jgi:hypothetical protein
MLAQTNTNSGNASIFVWTLVLLGVVLVGFVIVSWARKRLTKQDESLNTGFTLSDLRRLHKEGKLSTEEFERAKSAIVATSKAALERKNPPKTGDQATGGSFTNPDV